MPISSTRRVLLFVLVDISAVLTAFNSALCLRFGRVHVELHSWLLPIAVAEAVFLTTFYVLGLYGLQIITRPALTVRRSFLGVMIAALVLSALYYALPALKMGRGLLLIMTVLVGFFSLWRMTLIYLLRRTPRRRCVVVGHPQTYLEVASRLGADEWPFTLLGILTDDEAEELDSKIVLGNPSELHRIVRNQQISDVVVDPQACGPSLVRQLLRARLLGIRVWSPPDFFQSWAGHIPSERLTDEWLVFNGGFESFAHLVTQRLKRILDLTLAAVGLLASLPLTLPMAFAIKLTSRGPILFRQERVGKNGRIFRILKFRTMTQRPASARARWTADRDNRITKAGYWLRRFHLDELPQLVNVLRGEMSFVGPRPEQPEFVEMLKEEIPYYMLRQSVAPGITGWAQVNFGYANSVEASREKLGYDLYYVRNLSLALDLLILFKTIRVALFGIQSASYVPTYASEMKRLDVAPARDFQTNSIMYRSHSNV